MKTIGVIISIIFVSNLYSQTLLLEENFDYSNGNLTNVSATWTESPTGSVDIQVVSGNLTYTDYPSSGIGSNISLNGGASGRSGVHRAFTTQSTDGITVYFSFLMKVDSTADMGTSSSDGDYFFNFQNSGTSVTRGNIYVRKGTDSTKFNIGLIKAGISSLTWHSTELDVGLTYLIVVAYTFISGSGNDKAKLWINPDLSGAEPSADIEIFSGSDAVDLGYIQFKQRPLSGHMDIDGLRVSDSWSQAPLPVELTSFSASIINVGVRLNWITETEVNNFGFEIERAKILSDQNWNYIGFVIGYGNSNSPKYYSYVDITANTGKYSYRLKQLDNDGSFTYSKTIGIDFDTFNNYELYQNFPNPFNPITTIKFNLPEESKVRLTVFNTLGEVVTTLINKNVEGGVHTIDFEASWFPSGLYFYELETAEFIQVKKMILIK